MSRATPHSFTESRLQLHYAVQLIAATGAALAEPKPDYSHASLRWDTSSRWFVGAPIAAAQPFKVAIDPLTLTVMMLDDRGEKQTAFSLIHRTLEDGFDWLRQEIAQRGADAERVMMLSYPPDDFPDHPLAHAAKFDDQTEARTALVEFYAITYARLQNIVNSIPMASPVYVWPHHFDMATLISLPTSHGEPESIGIGFSPGDKTYAEPYWYVSPYPYPEAEKLPPLTVGFWHTTDWVGAVLLASQLHSGASSVSSFLDLALDAARMVLNWV